MPSHPSALEHAIVLHRQGRIDDAAHTYRAFTKSHPDLAEPWHLLGVIALQRGDPQQAEPLMREALQRDGEHLKCRSNLGATLYELGRFEDAEAELRAALHLNATHVDALYNLGNVLAKLDRADEAMGAYAKVLSLNPNHVKALSNTGILHLEADQFAEAETYLRRALAIAPDDFVCLLNLARVQERQNQIKEAQESITRVLAQQPDFPKANLLAARIEYRQKHFPEAIGKLEKAISHSDELDVAVQSHYTLGLTYDGLGQADKAFLAFAHANKLERQQAIGDGIAPGRYRQRIQAAHQRLESPFEPALTGVPRLTDAPRQPVFFVGFPRSGTTLLEQILAAHARVMTSNEVSPLAIVAREIVSGPPLPNLTNADWSRHRAHFWDVTQTSVGNITDRLLVDKMPLNIEYLDIAARLFPESKILMALRDPRDVCLSCFMQHFQRTHAMANFLDLNDTAVLYDAVMGLWLKQRKTLPLAWREYRYEDLVEDMEATLRSILDFLALEWSDSILEYRSQSKTGRVITPSYAQVGEKLYSRARGRWTKYARHLQPIVPTLTPYIDAFGYER